MKYAFWPGCVARGAAPELYKSTLAVAEHIGIELDELDAASCTGAGIISDSDPYLQDVLNARTMAIAEQKGLPLLDICSTCVGVHNLTREKLQNEDFRARINERLAPEGLEYKGTADPRHLLWILLEDLEEGKLNHLITRPLNELNLGPFYGCYILRPERVLGFEEHPHRRQSLEAVINLVGATSVTYDGMTKCCGFPILTINRKNSLTMAGSHVAEAKDKGADALVTPCPLCHLNLDAQQFDAAKVIERKLEVPILHVPQLIGLAMGLDPEALGLNRHVVSTKPLLEKVGAL
ncbi:MAG: CoB--CoM heterodisulfide reductase iron-sulfur subunit B family protein [Chloroflexi bacterium]|nr:CoB--CoM heterodisulfide reductase iron-sulfur subunit B family protein [Chloroflexota bacterium]